MLEIVFPSCFSGIPRFLQFLLSLVVVWSSGASPGGSRRCRAESKQIPRGQGKARAPERWPESSGRGLDSKLARLWPCHLLAFLVSLARLLRQPCHEPGRLQSKLARLWPCHLLAFLVSLARLLRQPCHKPGRLQSKLARLWPCHLLDSRPSVRRQGC